LLRVAPASLATKCGTGPSVGVEATEVIALPRRRFGRRCATVEGKGPTVGSFFSSMFDVLDAIEEKLFE
jgi:hypothetical protein